MKKLIYNAKIYTLNPVHPAGSAILIDSDRILSVSDDAANLFDAGEAVDELASRTVSE